MSPRPPPFRAEHVGSLLRSAKLLQRRAEVDAGESDQLSLLRQIEDDDIREAVALQRELGFHAITDGEFRRSLYWGSFFQDLEGFEEIHVKNTDLFRPYGCDVKLFAESGDKGGDTVLCTGKIKHVRNSYLEHFTFLKSLVPPEEVKNLKMSLASPEWYHMRYKNGLAFPQNVYPSSVEYFADIAAAFRAELAALYDAGLRNVVIDNPNFGFCCDDSFAKGWEDDETNTKTLVEQVIEYIEVMNDCLADLPTSVATGVHLCRGNFMSRHWASGGYSKIARELFTRSKVNTFYLEYDTSRAGGFEPLKMLPMDKFVVLGLVSSKFGQLEDVDALKERVFEAARLMAQGSGETEQQALRRISVSPQCGFASAKIGNMITPQDQRAKLELVRKVADAVWPGEP